MIDFYKFFAQKDVQEAVKAKIRDVQENGFVEKEFDGMLGDKKVKMILPNDVRKQLYLLKIGDQWMTDSGQLLMGGVSDLETAYNMSVNYLENITKNMLIDGEEVKDLNQIPVEDLKAYGLVYYLELLLPLSHRSATKSEESVRQILKGYLKK